jgi:hypothetical protein
MSNSLRLVMALGFVAFAAACSQPEEVVYVEEPVVMEPATTKY